MHGFLLLGMTGKFKSSKKGENRIHNSQDPFSFFFFFVYSLKRYSKSKKNDVINIKIYILWFFHYWPILLLDISVIKAKQWPKKQKIGLYWDTNYLASSNCFFHSLIQTICILATTLQSQQHLDSAQNPVIKRYNHNAP
jgi:hypothetical protein